MTNTNKDFRGAKIIDLGHGAEIVSYPAFDYMHSTDPDSPICADKGGEHLGERAPGIAVALPTRTHGMMHKHFGLGVYDKDDSWGNKAGDVFAYGMGAVLTSHKRAKQWLAAAHLGDTILFNGKRYRIEPASNDNIGLVAV